MDQKYTIDPIPFFCCYSKMDIVAEIETIPLDGVDLESMSQSLGNSATKSIMYDQLDDETLSSLFDGVNAVYILYEIINKDGKTDKSTVGHWVCLLKNGDKLCYYDPYGLSISQDLHITGEPDHFTRLFKGVKVGVNSVRHQKFRDELNTCGRHCVSRSLFWRLSNEDYDKRVIKPILSGRQVKDPDVFVTLLTAFLDKSDRVLSMFSAGGKGHFSGSSSTGGSSSHFSS